VRVIHVRLHLSAVKENLDVKQKRDRKIKLLLIGAKKETYFIYWLTVCPFVISSLWFIVTDQFYFVILAVRLSTLRCCLKKQTNYTPRYALRDLIIYTLI